MKPLYQPTVVRASVWKLTQILKLIHVIPLKLIYFFMPLKFRKKDFSQEAFYKPNAQELEIGDLKAYSLFGSYTRVRLIG